jgi:alkylated DNA repair dioxygenase AlkB
VAAAEPLVLALGARRLSPPGQSGAVYADPAGHPFCLITRPGWAPPIGGALAPLDPSPAGYRLSPPRRSWPGPGRPAAVEVVSVVAAMRGVVERPAGLIYRPDLLDEAEERSLLGALTDLDYDPVVLHGQAAKRTVRHFGYTYEFGTGDLVPAEPLPPPLVALRDRCADLAGIAPERLAQALVTRYPPGAAIGWHRDAPQFGSPVAGVSLLSPCTMRFQRRVGGERRVFELDLAPRSAYVLSGAARATWQHSIPPVPLLRYSVTFRTVRAG